MGVIFQDSGKYWLLHVRSPCLHNSEQQKLWYRKRKGAKLSQDGGWLWKQSLEQCGLEGRRPCHPLGIHQSLAA